MPQTATPAGTPTATATTVDGKSIALSVPQTAAEVAALESRRVNIRNQIIQASDRRQELVRQIRSAPEGVARTGLEQRMEVLDQNLLQLERELVTIGDQLAAAPPELVRYQSINPNKAYNNGFDDGVGAGIGGSIAVFAVVMLFRWFRRRKKPKVKQERRDESPSMQDLERGIEAIAIEVERISEGQRFVTKLLAEGNGPVAALGNRAVEPAQKPAQ